MKLLIIAGPYEADRLRKAAVSAGFEAVAVEPGESLSGWITASRPALIVMAPQMVHPDPAQALAKVRSVPRGRVPIFLVGDAADEPRMAGLADGFFIRPVVARRAAGAGARGADRVRHGRRQRRAAPAQDARRAGTGDRPPARSSRRAAARRGAGRIWARPAVAEAAQGTRGRRRAQGAADPASGGRRERAARGAERRHRRSVRGRAVARAGVGAAHASRPPRASASSTTCRPTIGGSARRRPTSARGAAGALRAGRGGRLLRGARHRARREHRRGPARARAHRARAGAGGDRSGAGRASWARSSTRSARSWARRCACSATSACGRATPEPPAVRT